MQLDIPTMVKVFAHVFKIEPASLPMLVFTVSDTAITVFTDTFAGVSKARTVNRLHTDHC